VANSVLLLSLATLCIHLVRDCELDDIEILLLPICERSRTLRALPKILAPKYMIPMHFGTCEVNEDNRFWTYGDPEEIKPRMKYPEKLTILKQGEAFRLS